MEAQQAAANLLAAHERDILTLQSQVEKLKAELKQLRADFLVSFKHAGPPRANVQRECDTAIWRRRKSKHFPRTSKTIRSTCLCGKKKAWQQRPCLPLGE